MAGFLLKRLLISLPVLLVVSIVAFFLTVSAPGDPVEDLMSAERELASGNVTYSDWIREYDRVSRRYGRNVPVFYVTVAPGGWPDTLYRITYKAERTCARYLLRRYGDWEGIDLYMGQLRQMASFEAGSDRFATAIVNDARYLLISTDDSRIDHLWSEISLRKDSVGGELVAITDRALATWDNLRRSQPGLAARFPSIHWYGSLNQYHIWMRNLLSGDFGISVIDGRSVSAKIREAIGWTLRINLTAILLAFAISIPLGLATGRMAGSVFDRTISGTLFILFAIPSFWLGTMLIVFFTTPEYGEWLDLFPIGGIGDYHYATGLRRFQIIVSSLFLPVLCLLLGALAYLTRQMRRSVISEAGKNYVRMARAKGLSDREVYRKHIFRNALFPIITLIGAAVPASISGSVIIEVLFNIPGMGRLLYESILGHDWMVVYAMVLIAAFFTIIGFLISDVLYRVVDPRLRISTQTA